MGRDDELRRALAVLDDDSEFRGVVLVGDAGVGKSTLARAVAAAVASRGFTVRFVLGTETASAVPLGAFYWLMTFDTAREPAVMLATAQRTLEKEANLVVVVDDAHLLDPLSATLVYNLAAGGSARLIVTINSGRAVPDTLLALWKEPLLLRLRINAFTRAQTAELARTVLGDAVDKRLVNELHRRTSGNLQMLRGLLNAARESGALVRTEYGWQLRGALHPDRELSDLLEFRLQSLPAEELEAVEILAVGEVLSWETLQGLCDADAVSSLERRGWIQLIADESHTVARLANPVLGEVAVQRAGIVRVRQLNGMLAQHLRKRIQAQEERSRSPDVRTKIRLAQFLMRSDLAPDLDVMIDAAASSMTMSNLAHSEKLARFAFDHGGGAAAAIVLAEAMSWQGKGQEAEAVLADVTPNGADERLIVQWGCARAANLFFDCGQVERARTQLAQVKDRVASRTNLLLVRALEGTFACFCGDVSKAIELGVPLSAYDRQPLAMAWAVPSTAWELALAGRFRELHRIAASRRAALLDQMGPHWFVMGLAEVLADTAAGDYPAAEQVCKRYVPAITVGPQADAFVHAMLGLVQLARGALPSACAAFHDSISAMSHGFPAGWLMLVLAWSAQAEGARGHGEAAAAALRKAEEAYGPQVAVFLPELELARAWERASVGETTDARQHALHAAQIAEQSGEYAVEMRALHTAVRFGDRSHTARMADFARLMHVPLAKAAAAHARGLANHDADLLDIAAGQFTDLGALALAADAAAQAAVEHARKGDRYREIESSVRAYALAGQGELRTPAVGAGAHPLPITDREREIAMLVADGLSNRQIADRLFVSVRTAEGHLYRIFAKLGINSRDQLIHLLNFGLAQGLTQDLTVAPVSPIIQTARLSPPQRRRAHPPG